MVKRFLATTMSVLYGFGGLFGHSDLLDTYNENIVYASEIDAYQQDNNYEFDEGIDYENDLECFELDENEYLGYCKEYKSIESEREALINAYPLQPMNTNSPEIDARVQDILSQIINNSMTTYQKIEAIWNWIICNTEYSSKNGRWEPGYKTDTDKRIAGFSRDVLFDGTASCAGYSAAFVVLTRAIGLNSYLVYGNFVNRNGNRQQHWWVNIKIGGTLYTFDPQIEDNMWDKKGDVPKSFFCRKDDEVADRYIYIHREDYIDDFNCFKSVSEGIVHEDETIKGICQMPYYGEGGGYLIGVETYRNPNQEYQYELLVLDCTLLAQGKDAWIYTTNRCNVANENAFWTVWQPQYGYYWTLFRVFDKNGYLLDEKCYGFQNVI